MISYFDKSHDSIVPCHLDIVAIIGMYDDETNIDRQSSMPL